VSRPSHRYMPYRFKKVEKDEPGTYIICVVRDGAFAPNTKPKVYTSLRQAKHVAQVMAERCSGERFVVMKSVGHSEVPKVATTWVDSANPLAA
jgi:hypothetical protein